MGKYQISVNMEDVMSWKGTQYFDIIERERMNAIKYAPIIELEMLYNISNLSVIDRVSDKYITIFGWFVDPRHTLISYGSYFRIEYDGDVEELRTLLEI